ncbi:hypothetical protein Tco_0576714 [Tanacetum coccineum]
MTWNLSQLITFVSKFMGNIRFRNDHVATIKGYGDYQIGNATNPRVYYVEGLGYTLFSVGKFCDSDLEVAFRKHTCFVRDLEGVMRNKADPFVKILWGIIRREALGRTGVYKVFLSSFSSHDPDSFSAIALCRSSVHLLYPSLSVMSGHKMVEHSYDAELVAAVQAAVDAMPTDSRAGSRRIR